MPIQTKVNFKRNVIDMKQTIKDKLVNHKPFQEHVYNVLHNSNIGKTLHYMAIYIINILCKQISF